MDEIERQIRAAEHFVVLFSKDSIRSDMVRQEVKLAYELFKQHQLTILPIRVAFLGELPLVLASLLNPIQYTLGNQGAPFEAIGAQILAAIERATALPISGKSTEEEASVAGMQSLFEVTEAVGAPLPQADPRLVPLLELETGTIKLDSPFYIRRQSDDEMLQQVSRVGTTTVVNGPRQMGKSSLLARAMAVAQQNQQKALYLLATNRWSLAALQNLMTNDFGPFGDHLRRFIWGLQRNPALKESLRQILRHQKCDDEMHFLRLRAVGLIKGETRDTVAMRCRLYEEYFENHL